MGYHLILIHPDDELECQYVKNVNELANYPLEEDSIIYEGEEQWKP